MDLNYFNSKKYILLLILICVLLAILTAKVFDYMPQPPEKIQYENYEQKSTGENFVKNSDTDLDNNNSAYDETASSEDEDEEDDDDSDSNTTDSEHKSGHFDFMSKSAYTNNADFDEIPAPPGTIEEQINAIDTN